MGCLCPLVVIQVLGFRLMVRVPRTGFLLRKFRAQRLLLCSSRSHCSILAVYCVPINVTCRSCQGGVRASMV